MRLPSLEELVSGTRSTLRRFPVVVAGALLSTAAALFLVDDPGSDAWSRLLVGATLSLPLLFALTLLAERRGWDGAGRGALYGLGLAALAAVYVAWPGWSDEVAVRRYLQLSAGFHLMAAFLPFVGAGEPNGFWQYNRSVFLRFLTATLYAAVLFAGLALALAALDHLFGLPVSGEAYLRLWIVVAFTFHPSFFLAGVPDDLAALASRSDYPGGLKIFTQYVLLPLVLIYLAILTAYAVRVMVTWDWPSGWIGWLVSGVAVAGIFALLLVHPVRRRAENAWVRAYGRWFWVTLLPSVALLVMAVWQRISQYGITEDRYFLLVLALWLAGIAVFHSVRRFENVELVPQTLAALALLTFVGPWSAYAVSERSQRARLEALLARHELVVDGRVRPARDTIPFEDRREISATVRYLARRHGSGALAPAFGGELPGAADGGGSAADTARAEPDPEAIVAALGLEYVRRWRGGRRGRHLVLVARRSMTARSVAGFDHVVLGLRSADGDTLRVAPGLRVTPEKSGVRVLREDAAPVTVPLTGLARRLEAAGHGGGRPVPGDEMWVEVEAEGLRAALWLESLRARETGRGELEDVSWSGNLFLGKAAAGTGGGVEPAGR